MRSLCYLELEIKLLGKESHYLLKYEMVEQISCTSKTSFDGRSSVTNILFLGCSLPMQGQQ